MALSCNYKGRGGLKLFVTLCAREEWVPKWKPLIRASLCVHAFSKIAPAFCTAVSTIPDPETQCVMGCRQPRTVL